MQRDQEETQSSTNQTEYTDFYNSVFHMQNKTKEPKSKDNKINRETMAKIVLFLQCVFKWCVDEIVEMYYDDSYENNYLKENFLIKIIWDAIITFINKIIQYIDKNNHTDLIQNPVSKTVMNIYHDLPAILSAEYRFEIINALIDNKNKQTTDKNNENSEIIDDNINISISSDNTTDILNKGNSISRKDVVTDIANFIHLYIYHSFDESSNCADTIKSMISSSISKDKGNQALIYRFSNFNYSFNKRLPSKDDDDWSIKYGFYQLFVQNVESLNGKPLVTKDWDNKNIICKYNPNEAKPSYIFKQTKVTLCVDKGRKQRRKCDFCYIFNSDNKTSVFYNAYKQYCFLKNYKLNQYVTSVLIIDENIINLLLEDPNSLKDIGELCGIHDESLYLRYRIYEYPERRVFTCDEFLNIGLSEEEKELDCIIKVSNYYVIQYPKSIGWREYLSLLADKGNDDKGINDTILQKKQDYDRNNVRTRNNNDIHNTNDSDITNRSANINQNVPVTNPITDNNNTYNNTNNNMLFMQPNLASITMQQSNSSVYPTNVPIPEKRIENTDISERSRRIYTESMNPDNYN